MTSSYTKIPKHCQMSMFWTLSFQLICLIQLGENSIKLVLKNVIKLAKGSLNSISQDSFNKILTQQLTHDRSYISTITSGVLHQNGRRMTLKLFWYELFQMRVASCTRFPGTNCPEYIYNKVLIDCFVFNAVSTLSELHRRN